MQGRFHMRARATVLAVAIAMMLASCSHGKSHAAANSPTSQSTSKPNQESTSRTTAKPTSGSTVSAPASPTPTSPTASQPSSTTAADDFCSQLHSFTASVADPKLPARPSDWKANYNNLEQEIANLRPQAPAQITGDLNTVANAYSQLVHTIDAAGGNIAQVMLKISSTYRAASFKAAVTALEQYVKDVCKLPIKPA